MGCGRTFCGGCGEEMIHRDHRQSYESASALGQIVGREGPVNISVTDIDLVARKGLQNGAQLLRIIEQKQPKHQLRRPQRETLKLLDACIGHCVHCEAAKDLVLDKRSGLYLMVGHIDGETSGRRTTRFNGPQIVTKFSDGRDKRLETHEEFFELLDPEDWRLLEVEVEVEGQTRGSGLRNEHFRRPDSGARKSQGPAEAGPAPGHRSDRGNHDQTTPPADQPPTGRGRGRAGRCDVPGARPGAPSGGARRGTRRRGSPRHGHRGRRGCR